jgi:thiol-disulfide isomerase/thioredoxin
VTLVQFWATTCSVCRQEMPSIVALQERFAGQGFGILAVAMRYDPPVFVADYAQAQGLRFDVAIDNTGAIARAFGDIEGTPTYCLIDRRGRIVQRHVGMPDFSALQRTIAGLLSET